MGKEIVFTPERETHHDLAYSEYSSCDRSIHILLQAGTDPKTGFLPKSFRETISRYLSSLNVETPLVFMRKLVEAFDGIAEEERLSPEDFKQMGLFILIHDLKKLYLLCTDGNNAFIDIDNDLLPISQIEGGRIAKLDFASDISQKELFPQRVMDVLTLYRIDLDTDETIVVMGCGVNEKIAIINALGTLDKPPEEASSINVPLKFISKKVVAGIFTTPVKRISPPIIHSVAHHSSGTSHRSFSTAAFIIAIIAIVVIGSIWGSKQIRKGGDGDTGIVESDLSTSVHQGILEESALPQEVAPSNETPIFEARLSLDWSVSFKKPVTSSPVVTGDLVMFGCRDGNFYALDRETGAIQWQYTSTAGMGASPALIPSGIVCANYNGDVFCLDMQNGTRMWQVRLPGRIVSSPLALGPSVVVGCYDHTLYSLNGGSGAIQWKRRTEGLIWASPAASANSIFAPSYDGRVYALSTETGEVVWRYALKGRLAASPSVGPSEVIVASPDGDVCALSLDSGELLWSSNLEAPIRSRIAISQSRIYLGTDDSYVYCLDLTTGSVLWKYGSGGSVLSRPSEWRNLVFVGSYDHSLYILDATTGKKIDSYQTDGEIYSSPAVLGGCVYFGNNAGTFYCLRFNAKKPL